MSVTDFWKSLIGVPEDDEEYDYIEVEEEMEEGQEPQFIEEELESNQYSDRRNQPVKATKPMNNKKVIGMPGVNNDKAEVMVVEPRTFSEMSKVIDSLRERKSIVLNLEMMDPQEAQRAVDFVAGGTYAMDGHYERVGDSIFLFTPSCVTVSNLSGLVSGADDFSSARNRRPAGKSSVDLWVEPTAAAQ